MGIVRPDRVVSNALEGHLMVARTKIAGGAVLVVAAALAVVAAGPALSAITAAGAGASSGTAAAAGPAGATTPFASYEAEAGTLGGSAKP